MLVHIVVKHMLLYSVMSVLMQRQCEFVHSQVTDAMNSDGFIDVQ